MSAIQYTSGIITSALFSSKVMEYKMLSTDSIVSSPPDTVSIIIPALNEELYIERCLKSLRNQSIALQYPQYFEYILVDNGSRDNTIKLATSYVDKIIVSPKGKLTARNIGTLYSKGNIIVAVDADIEFPYHWLNTLLKPFNNPDTVAVSGSIIDNNYPGVPKPLYILGATLGRTIVYPQRMMGGNCSYYKHLFYLSGQFNTSINQTDVKQMVQEEELGFGKRLSKYGKVIYKHNAPGIHLGSDRIKCRFFPKSKNCERYKIGIERFGK
ncbi:MAG: glycosyltransferase family 2 protein [Candidatus Dojkabacteria bacterium]|nr:glycosyltransferase family 2 protein [Candidatus Dojkabacteria bacterium]